MPRWIENTIRVIVYGPVALIFLAAVGAGLYFAGVGAYDSMFGEPLVDPNREPYTPVPIGEQIEMVYSATPGMESSKNEGGDHEYESVASQSGWYSFNEGNIVGCKDQADYARLMQFVSSRDRAAFDLALTRYTAQGKCHTFQAGQKVFLQDLTFTKRQLRPEGSVDAYWVSARQGMLAPIEH